MSVEKSTLPQKELSHFTTEDEPIPIQVLGLPNKIQNRYLACRKSIDTVQKLQALTEAEILYRVYRIGKGYLEQTQRALEMHGYARIPVKQEGKKFRRTQ